MRLRDVETIALACEGVGHVRAAWAPGVVRVFIWGPGTAFECSLCEVALIESCVARHLFDRLLHRTLRPVVAAGPSWEQWAKAAAEPDLDASGARGLLLSWPPFCNRSEVLAVIEEHWPLWIMEDHELGRRVQQLRQECERQLVRQHG